MSARVASEAPGRPRVIVCAGGGGVGKTTSSAAIALALARSGARALIVTIDPARRLAGAMGVPISDVVTPVPAAGTEGRLFALMPDPRRSLHTFLDQLFEGEPAARARLADNRLYQGLADAAAGVHELVAMNLVAHASTTGAFDVVVIDTAPSRHAIDFVTYPGRLAALLGGRTVGWLSGLAQRAEASPAPASSRGGLLSWGSRRVEGLLARVTGPNLVGDTASLFGELALVRERFVARADRASELLLGEQTAYALVAAPTAAARDDVLYLAKRLDKLGRRPTCLVLNRADVTVAPFLAQLAASTPTAPVAAALAALSAEQAARILAAGELAQKLTAALPGVPVVQLPHVEASAPELVVGALAAAVTPHLRTLLPGWG